MKFTPQSFSAYVQQGKSPESDYRTKPDPVRWRLHKGRPFILRRVTGNSGNSTEDVFMRLGMDAHKQHFSYSAAWRHALSLRFAAGAAGAPSSGWESGARCTELRPWRICWRTWVFYRTGLRSAFPTWTLSSRMISISPFQNAFLIEEGRGMRFQSPAILADFGCVSWRQEVRQRPRTVVCSSL